MDRRQKTQGSLEYIIIIGGVIILAVATYFMLRGFAQTTGEDTTEAMGAAGEILRLEVENLGRSETKFFTKKWGSFPLLSRLTLNNTGEPAKTDLTLYNLTDYGISLDQLEFAYNDSGSIETLDHAIQDSTVSFTTPSLPSGISEILLFHNISSALDLDCLNYTSSNSNVTITDGTSPVQSPDVDSPFIVISDTAYGLQGSVKDADIQVTVTDATSSITEVHYSIGNSPYFRADNLYYGYQDIKAEAHPEDYAYDSNSETVRIIVTVPEEDNYTVRVRAVDEYGNEREETQTVSVLIGSSPDITPPVILSTQPLNNSEVYDSPITINITTNEIAHCRYDTSPGTPYSSMSDMDGTDSTNHSVTSPVLMDDQYYEYYFKCNDTSGNVNETEYLLNFTKRLEDIIPPAVLTTEPTNNSLVYASPITINVTTNEIAHCRFSNESGTPYPSMINFNNTDSLTHNITNVFLQDGYNYTYYFRCNDSNGIVNDTDYVLNFTKKVAVIPDTDPPTISSLTLMPQDPDYFDHLFFNATVNDSSGVSWCNLTVNDSVVIDEYSMNLSSGTYVAGIQNRTIQNWTAKINCSDANNNTAVSSMNFEVTNYSVVTFYMGGTVWAEHISLADLNGDGREDIAMWLHNQSSGEYNVSAIDGYTNASLWNVYNGTQFGAFDPVAIDTGDVNRDGVADVCFASGLSGFVHCLNGSNGVGLWDYEFGIYPGQSTFDGLEILVADVTGEGYNEVFVNAYDDGQQQSTFLLLNGSTGAVLWENTMLGGDFAVAADFDGDGVNEIAATVMDYQVRVLEGSDGSELWVWNNLLSVPIFRLAAGDLDNDGIEDLAVSLSGNLIAINGTNAEQLWNLTEGPWDKGKTVAIGDIDGGGDNELVAVVESNTVAYEGSNGNLIWTRGPQEGGASHVVLGDLDNDGLDDVLVGEGTAGGGPVLYTLKGATGDFIWILDYNAYHCDWPNDLGVGDLDGNRRLDIVSSMYCYIPIEPYTVLSNIFTAR